MRTLSRFEPFRGASSLQDQINRLFNDVFERPGDESNLTSWAPAVDIFETEARAGCKSGPSGRRPQGFGHPGGEQYFEHSR